MLSLAMATVSEETALVRCCGVEASPEAFRSELPAERTVTVYPTKTKALTQSSPRNTALTSHMLTGDKQL